MTLPDDSSDQQINSYIKIVSGDNICCDDKDAEMNDKERNEEKRDAMVAFIKFKVTYDDSNDDYFLADIPDNYDINFSTRNYNNHYNNNKNQNKVNNKNNQNDGNSENKNNGDNNTKKKKTFVTMMCSLLQLKYRVKMM